MTVFRYEWRRSRKYIITWAVVLAACIFFMTPVYYDMLGNPEKLPAGFAQGAFLRLLGSRWNCSRNPLECMAFSPGS